MFRYLRQILLGIIILASSSIALAQEALVIIDAVSSSRKTFVIQRGAQDRITIGTESLFSNNNISILAKVIEVTRQHSLWRIKESNAIFPFKKDESVVFNKNRTNIWNEIPDLKARVTKAKKKEEDYTKLYGSAQTYQLRGNLSNTFYESTTDTDSQRAPERTGIHIEGLYKWRLWEKFEIGIGLRYDKENAIITEPDLTIPTTRIIGLAELTYHFSNFKGQGNNFYMAAALGVGRSQTEVNEAVSTGLATVLPSIRLGYIFRRPEGFDFTFATVVEAISAKESFIDTKEQTTNLVNAKIAFGVRF
jgi:hypothetical protein